MIGEGIFEVYCPSCEKWLEEVHVSIDSAHLRGRADNLAERHGSRPRKAHNEVLSDHTSATVRNVLVYTIGECHDVVSTDVPVFHAIGY